MKSRMPVVACCLLSVAALGASQRAFADTANGQLVTIGAETVYRVTIASGDVKLNAADVAVLAANPTVPMLKDGAGRLIVEADLAAAGWDGELRITNGYYRIDGETGALGGIVGATRVSGAGQLEHNFQKDNFCATSGENLFLEGSGPDGSGAFRYVKDKANQFTLGRSGSDPKPTLTLTGPTTIGSKSKRMEFRAFETVDMGGYDLTVNAGSGGCGAFALVGGSLKNSGDIYVRNTTSSEFVLCFEGVAAFDATVSQKTIHFAAKTHLMLTNMKIDMPYGIETAGTWYVYDGNWGATTMTCSGPVKLGGHYYNQMHTNFTIRFTGPFDPNGKILKGGSNNGRTEFLRGPGSGEFLVGGMGPDGTTFRLKDIGVYRQTAVSGISSEWGKSLSRLEIAGNVQQTNDTANGRLYVGGTGTKDVLKRGVLEINDGVGLTNQVYAGFDPNCHGSIFQRGGWFGVKSGTGYLGQNTQGALRGEAYYELSGGTFQQSQWVLLGLNGGHGVFRQSGGEVLACTSDGFALAHGSNARASACLDGGTFRQYGQLLLCKFLWASGNETASGAKCDFTVDGGSFAMVTGGAVELGAMSNSTAVLNLNAGTMKVGRVRRSQTFKSIHYQRPDVAIGGNAAYVNFDGGTLEPVYTDIDLLESSLTRVTVYGGGAVFKMSQNTFIAAPLQAPTGSGVSSIPFDCAIPWQYVGAPYVEITGDGTGASAVAEFDSTNGVITGVRVTSPGCGYTWAKAVISQCGYTNRVEVVPTLSANVTTGGIAAVGGTGKLTLNAVNTYGGVTRVADGATVKAGVAGAIPSGSGLVLDTGTIDLNGFAHTAATLSGTNGTVKGDLTLTGSLMTDAELRRADVGQALSVEGRLTFASGAKVRLANAGVLTDDMESYPLVTATGGITGTPGFEADAETKWCLSVRGNTLWCRKPRGMVMVIR